MFKDSVYLITGGASGLGLSTAELLYQEGANIVICDVNKSNFIEDPERVLKFEVDVTSEQDIETVMKTVERKFGKLNGIINCAGITVVERIYDEKTKKPHSLESFRNVINVNLVGTFNVIRLGVPLMINNIPNKDGERGVIITTSSALAKHGIATMVGYSSSKGGTLSMIVPLSKELSQYGIRVLDINPGKFDTPILQKCGKENAEVYLFPRRGGKPQEYAHIVKTIIENAYLNGTSIEVDAGGFR